MNGNREEGVHASRGPSSKQWKLSDPQSKKAKRRSRGRNRILNLDKVEGRVFIRPDLDHLRKAPRAYSDWKQVAGYFDGDGNVNVKIMKFTLLFRLDWTDTDKNQIMQLKRFLSGKGVAGPAILAYKPDQGRMWYNLRISTIESVVKVAESMIPFSFKKSYELRLCVAYLRDRVTGKKVVTRLNKLVRTGIRSGDIRNAQHLSFTHSEGVRLARINSSTAAALVNSVLTYSQREEIKQMYDSGRLGLTFLARKFNVSKNTIERILREKSKSYPRATRFR